MSRQDKLAHLFFFAFAPPPKSLSQRQRSPIRREGSQRGSHSLVSHLQNQCSSHWRCTDNFHENKISVQWRDTSTLSDKYAHSKIFAESDTHTCVSGLHPLKSKNSIIHDSSNSFFIYPPSLSGSVFRTFQARARAVAMAGRLFGDTRRIRGLAGPPPA